MIIRYNFINNVKINTINKVRKLISPLKLSIPKFEQLKKDIFELKEGMPDVLMNNPPIYTGKYDFGLKDRRFIAFDAEYRAFDFEGYDTKFPNDYVCIDSKGDRRLKPHVYLKFVEVHPEFARQGAYKGAIKRLVEFVKFDNECQGRISLDARKVESPTMTKIPSPSVAHWKCGFRFVNKEDNKVMQKVLAGELPLENAPEGTMYYPVG